MKKVCIVTCYPDPDYVRARTLRSGLIADENIETIVIKNRHRGVLRYPEVVLRLLAVRLRHNPDVYLLTFRGYEMLPFLRVIGAGKQRIFDEFINLIEWTVYEHHKFSEGSLAARLLWHFYRILLKRCDVILTDTQAHADYSANLMKLPLSKYKAVPVSTDEQVFAPIKVEPAKDFQVFYYGNMLPLHGLQYLLDAAVQLRDNKKVKFLCVGGSRKTKMAIAEAQQQGARIEHKSWVPFDELPKLAAQSELCVGGPLGGTLQARMVITGKTYQFLCMGRPTLVGAIDEAPIFKDKENCLLVPQANTDAIVEAIQWALGNKKALKKIGENGKKLYLDQYSNRAVANILREVVHDVLV